MSQPMVEPAKDLWLDTLLMPKLLVLNCIDIEPKVPLVRQKTKGIRPNDFCVFCRFASSGLQ